MQKKYAKEYIYEGYKRYAKEYAKEGYKRERIGRGSAMCMYI